jgi:tetratricopeptide (TPR) repeat protein
LLLAVGAGIGIYKWLSRSLVAAIVVGWYVYESVPPCALLFGVHRRQVALAYVLPRAASTAIAFALTYLVVLPWDQALVLTYVGTLVLEGAYRLVLQVLNVKALEEGRRTLAGARGQDDRTFGPGRAVSPWSGGDHRLSSVWMLLTILFAALLILAFSLTLYAFGSRQVALDTRFYVSQYEELGLHEEVTSLASEVVLDMARQQGPDVRRAIALLSDQDVHLAEQMILPEQWTIAAIEQTLEATTDWLQADDDRRVPPISVALGDVERHLQDAVSMLLDRRLAALPLCRVGMAANAFCRPEEMSVVAFVATFKPEGLAIVDESLALIPAELDLSTAVTLSPRTFQGPLAALAQLRERIQAWDRALTWAGIGCLAAWAMLSWFCARTVRTWLLWMGGTTCAAGVGAWAVSWTLSIMGPRPIWGQLLTGPLSDLPEALAVLILRALPGFVRAVHTLVSPWELALAATGLLMVLVGSIASPRPRRRLAGGDGVRVVVVLLALNLVFWPRYVDSGRRVYERAFTAHRRGEVDEATRLYRQVVRWYPFAVDDFVAGARRGLRGCQRFQRAESLYQRADYTSAVGEYEAFLISNPVGAVRDLAERRLLDALYEWAGELGRSGAYERALDRYRFIQDAYRNRRVSQEMSDLYVAWGQGLQKEGDYPGAIATYRRLIYDVPSPRSRTLANEQIANAYCAWSASLHAGGEGERAATICDEFDQLLGDVADRCSACRP